MDDPTQTAREIVLRHVKERFPSHEVEAQMDARKDTIAELAHGISASPYSYPSKIKFRLRIPSGDEGDVYVDPTVFAYTETHDVFIPASAAFAFKRSDDDAHAPQQARMDDDGEQQAHAHAVAAEQECQRREHQERQRREQQAQAVAAEQEEPLDYGEEPEQASQSAPPGPANPPPARGMKGKQAMKNPPPKRKKT